MIGDRQVYLNRSQHPCPNGGGSGIGVQFLLPPPVLPPPLLLFPLLPPLPLPLDPAAVGVTGTDVGVLVNGIGDGGTVAAVTITAFVGIISTSFASTQPAGTAALVRFMRYQRSLPTWACAMTGRESPCALCGRIA